MWASKKEIKQKRDAAAHKVALADRVRSGNYGDIKDEVARKVIFSLNLSRELCHRSSFSSQQDAYMNEADVLLLAELAWEALKLDERWPKCSWHGCTNLASYPEHDKAEYCYSHAHLYAKKADSDKSTYFKLF